MKKFAPYILIAFVFIACNSDTKNTETEEEIVETETYQQPKEIADIPWAAVLDSTSQIITMTATEGINAKDLNLDNVTESINRKYPEILISNILQKSDTVFVKINDATYLTQGSGSMGAEIFLAESTYSFTQIPGINFVNFDFKIGDHASPGTFKRTDFEFKK
ncbi:hypothetical protein [Pedobacter alpinus]|uniref:DUF4840 domain-containing protein n=1 Tax=Pedobacter alpinus TaxID=1590643 RepID=A0ABW5TSI1_9SPHI